MRESVAEVDSDNFFEWAKKFIEDVRALAADGRRVFLIYDGYRSHMNLRALSLSRDNDTIVYALPTHTSGKTQPLDVALFGRFKRIVYKILDECTTASKIVCFNMYEFAV